MPLDVRGCTRATMKIAARFENLFWKVLVNAKYFRDWDRGLQLLPLNEEFPVNSSHQLELITSLPFVHTARRYYRLNGLVRSPNRRWGAGNGPCC